MLEEEKVVEEEAKEEVKEEKPERVIVEKDGKTYAKVPDEKEEKKEAETEEIEEEETEEETEEEGKEEESEEEVEDKFKGKSVDELRTMVTDRDKTIGDQGTELEGYRKKDPEKMTKEEWKKELTSPELKSAMTKTKSELRVAQQELQDMDEDVEGKKEMKKARDKVALLEKTFDELEIDYNEKRSDERIDQKLLSKGNEEFLAKKRLEFKDKLDIAGEEFDKIAAQAKRYVGEDGLYTYDSLGHAMIDLKNFEGAQKVFEMNGEAKARKDIHIASKKEKEKVSTKTTGKRTKLIRVTDDMDTRQVRKIVDNMPDEELFDK